MFSNFSYPCIPKNFDQETMVGPFEAHSTPFYNHFYSIISKSCSQSNNYFSTGADININSRLMEYYNYSSGIGCCSTNNCNNIKTNLCLTTQFFSNLKKVNESEDSVNETFFALRDSCDVSKSNSAFMKQSALVNILISSLFYLLCL